MASGAFRLPPDEDVPPPFAAKKWRSAFADDGDGQRLTLAVMPSVSPAAAGIPYVVKREAWERLCYTPGLRDHEVWRTNCVDREGQDQEGGRRSRYFVD